MANENRNQQQNKPPAGQQLLQALESMPVAQRANDLKSMLTTRIQSIEDILPLPMRGKGEGQRLINRASMYFAAKKEVQEYSTVSIVQAIVQAAEVGLAVDGKLAHIVKFKGEAVLVIDWKGLVAVAKRSNQIYDCYGDIVGKNDTIVIGRAGPDSRLEHQPNLDDRGDVRGAYTIIKLPEIVNGQREWRYEYMTRIELDKVKNAAPSKSGPWSTWFEEMCKKAVVRRALKMYSDDPALSQALELSDAGDGYTLDVESNQPQAYQRARPEPLNLGSPPPSIGHTPADLAMPGRQREEQQYDAEPRNSERKTQRRQETQQTEQRQDAGPPKESVNEDAEPSADEEKAPDVKLSKAASGWMDWIKKTDDLDALTEAFNEAPQRTDLNNQEKTILLKELSNKIRKFKAGGPPGQLFETQPHA